MKKIITTPEAPAPIGPYNQAVLFGNMLFVSGQIAIDPVSGDLKIDEIESETIQVMKNIGAILKAANMTFANIVKTTIFLSDMELFGKVNQVYGDYFTEDFPARETVAVKALPKYVNVEIAVIAVMSEK